MLTVRLCLAAAFLLVAPPALAQHHDQAAPHDQPAADSRIGDPYPLPTCPISGKKLGEMGDPVVKTYEGREVRFCCNSCPRRFEKDLPASLAKLDRKIAEDQRPIYPLKTSVVSGKDLPEQPVEFVYGNRLVLLAEEGEKAEFLKDPKKYLEALNRAVIADQVGSYPLKTCPASGDELGAMGEPKDVVLAGRLIRLCCNDCKADLEREPARFIALIDAARAQQPGPQPARNGNDGRAHEPRGR